MGTPLEMDAHNEHQVICLIDADISREQGRNVPRWNGLVVGIQHTKCFTCTKPALPQRKLFFQTGQKLPQGFHFLQFPFRRTIRKQFNGPGSPCVSLDYGCFIIPFVAVFLLCPSDRPQAGEKIQHFGQGVICIQEFTAIYPDQLVRVIRDRGKTCAQGRNRAKVKQPIRRGIESFSGGVFRSLCLFLLDPLSRAPCQVSICKIVSIFLQHIRLQAIIVLPHLL